MPPGGVDREAADAFLVDRFGPAVSNVTPLAGGVATGGAFGPEVPSCANPS